MADAATPSAIPPKNGPAADSGIGSKSARDNANQDAPEPWPATLLLGISWIAIFVAMAWHQGSLHQNPGQWLAGGINTTTAYLFGSISTIDIQRGQYWRCLTATFVHFSILHLVVNLVVLYQLGRMVEPWYGSAAFLAVYVLIGGAANLAAGLVRPWIGLSTLTPSGGGSGVLCGLIALVAIVGWRSRDRRGQHLLMVMALQLLFLGAMGLVSTHVKNLVHAAGALVGIVVGLFDPILFKLAGTRRALALGALALASVVGSFVALVRGNADDHAARQHDVRLATALQQEAIALTTAEKLYLRLASAPPFPRDWKQRNALVLNPLARVLRQVGLLERSTALMQPKVQRDAWLELMLGAFHSRPHPGEVARLRSINDRFVGAATLRLDEGRRVLGTWAGRLPPMPNLPR